MELIRSLQALSDMALLLISHDLALVSTMCERLVVLHRGEIVEAGETRQVISAPRHGYTRSLLAATPTLGSAAAA
jgi:ABC-type glutathione transport system ATPase component